MSSSTDFVCHLIAPFNDHLIATCSPNAHIYVWDFNNLERFKNGYE